MNPKKLLKLIAVPICLAFFIINFAVPASADLGPKPSVHVRFENMSDELCYGTLLSKEGSIGPVSAWDGTEQNAIHTGNPAYSSSSECFDYAIWKAFAEYKDADGYYFLQSGWTVSETKEIDWTTFPPSSFKILLYYPQTETFVVSGIYEKYAFHAYYTVDMSETSVASQGIVAQRTHRYGQEAASLVFRIILTIAIEMAVALFFDFRRKKQFLVLAAVNVITQVVLNILLNVINYNTGLGTFVLYYLLFEAVVIVLEAILYCTVLKKVSEQPQKNGYYVRYAIVANAVSFGAGVIMAWMLSLFL